jgi:phage-related protein
MSWALEFYRSLDGGSPVENWLDGLPPGEAGRAVRGLDILRTYGTQLGMPHVREGGPTPSIFGLRRRGQPEHRMFYIPVSGQRFLILHGCTKQAPGTPPADAALARERQQDYLKRMAGRQG